MGAKAEGSFEPPGLAVEPPPLKKSPDLFAMIVWSIWNQRNHVRLCKVVIYKYVFFVGFYSMPNLIVILFNLVYPVFIVGCDCKGCVLERERV